MNRKKLYWNYFGIQDFFTLLFGLVLDTFHKRIPRRIFLAKNVLDHVHKKNGAFTKNGNEVKFDLGAAHYLLRNAGSDLDVFHQIIIGDGLKRLVELTKVLKIDDLHIIDCGANIGLTTIVFKQNFPKSKIISLEPEPGNYTQLCKNVALNNNGDICLLNIGVWYEKTTLKTNTNFRDGKNWSFALTAEGHEPATGIQVDSLKNIAASQGWNRIDVLKIDIEGSEFALLRNIDKWQEIWKTVRIVSIEVHEEVGSLFEIAEILWTSGFKLEIDGELIIGFRD
jgi:FkbM family methyltransferase